jgi:hypothetical protein
MTQAKPPGASHTARVVASRDRQRANVLVRRNVPVTTNTKDLEDLNRDIGAYTHFLTGMTKQLHDLADDLKDHDKVCLDVTDMLESLIKDLKGGTLDKEDQKKLNALLAKWGKTNFMSQMQIYPSIITQVWKKVIVAQKTAEKLKK